MIIGEGKVEPWTNVTRNPKRANKKCGLSVVRCVSAKGYEYDMLRRHLAEDVSTVQYK